MKYLHQTAVRKAIKPGRRVKPEALRLMDLAVGRMVGKVNAALDDNPGQRTIDAAFVAFVLDKYL